jgi:formylglycine-generating enzyme required for sulfatase activity
MSGKIFVNYRREDSAARALSIAQYLEKQFGARNVFLDIDRMRAGLVFPKVLEERLNVCKVMIVVIGPSWLGVSNEAGARRLDDPDDWVRLEIARALQRGITVIPVLVDGAVLPRRLDLPIELQQLVDRHLAVITTNGFRNDMAGLVRDIEAIPSPLPWGRIGVGAAIAALLVWVVIHVVLVNIENDHIARQNEENARREQEHVRRKEEDARRKEDDARRIADAEAACKHAKMEAARSNRTALADLEPGNGQNQWARDTLADGSPCPFCPEMVVVPGGKFTMGSPVSEEGRANGEDQVPATIREAFAVSRFEAIFDEWDACVEDGGCKNKRRSGPMFKCDKLPVESVSWDEVVKEYLPWLSRRTGKAYRLLSETEWEYVARAGTSTRFWWGSPISVARANFLQLGCVGDCGRIVRDGMPNKPFPEPVRVSRPVAVDMFKPNLWGLYNVHGNVSEWTQDCWNSANIGNPGDGTARSTGDCSLRVIRGGSSGSKSEDLRSARREKFDPESESREIGFRVARPLSR